MSTPPAAIGFLEWRYCYVSVSTQIPHGDGLELTPHTGRKFLFHQESTSMGMDPRHKIEKDLWKDTSKNGVIISKQIKLLKVNWLNEYQPAHVPFTYSSSLITMWN